MRYLKASSIAAPPSAVFAFHESGGALQRLTPPWERTRLIDGGTSLLPGSRVVLETWVGPFPLRWVAEHTEYAPPGLFADRQLKGPFASWEHRHVFSDDGAGGTVLRDEVEYELPWGALGRRLAGRYVRQKLERLFAFRHDATRRIVESGDFAETASPRDDRFR